jgi:lysozyme
LFVFRPAVERLRAFDEDAPSAVPQCPFAGFDDDKRGAMTSTNTVRDQAVQVAQSVVGLGANRADPQNYLRYWGLVAPGETLSMQESMGDSSGCGLVVAGIWRAIGVWDGSLYAPYKTGTAVSRLYNLAVARGAWVAYSASQRPSPGDMVLVEAGTSEEHVFTVIDISADGNSLTTVDGGQRDGSGYEIILQKTRTWEGSTDVCGSTRRTISGWADITRLPVSTAPVFAYFQNAPDDIRGFVGREALDAATAQSRLAAGYQFCLRTLPATGQSGGLTRDELNTLFSAGLAVMAFAARPSAGWDPSARNGSADAQQAAEAARSAGLGVGAGVWLELADVAASASASAIESYCNAWSATVLSYGYTPGLYVGQSPGLTGDQLYSNISASHYAKGASGAPEVSTRGYQIEPSSSSSTDLSASPDAQQGRAPWMALDPVVAGSQPAESTPSSPTTSSSTTSSPTSVSQTLGVDVSTYQGTLDWSTAAFDAEFAFIKATEGVSITDSQFSANWENAGKAAVLRSAYHYYTHDVDPVAQADHFLAVVGTGFDLPLALDLEDVKGVPPPHQLAANVKAFLDRVEEQSGRRPIIYTMASFWMTYMPAVSWATDYDLWVANWDVTTPLLPPPWTSWKFWQFKAGYKVPGKTKSVDLNWFAGSSADLQAYAASGSSAAPPAQAPAPPPAEAPSTIQVTATSLNVRLGPTTSAEKIGEVPEGSVLSVIDRATDGAGNQWYGVELWVAGTYGGSTYVKPV